MAEKKKSGCLSGCFNFILVLLILAVVGYAMKDKVKETKSTTTKPTATVRITPSPAPTPYVPGIAGSNAYDITVGIEKLGFDVGKRASTNYGTYYWSASWVDGTVYNSMYVETNKDYAVLNATFSMTNGDNGFLYYAATMPYTAKDQEKTIELTKSKTEKTITLGDAVWTIHPSDNGVTMLRVHDVDFESWMDKTLAKMG